MVQNRDEYLQKHASESLPNFTSLLEKIAAFQNFDAKRFAKGVNNFFGFSKDSVKGLDKAQKVVYDRVANGQEYKNLELAGKNYYNARADLDKAEKAHQTFTNAKKYHEDRLKALRDKYGNNFDANRTRSTIGLNAAENALKGLDMDSYRLQVSSTRNAFQKEQKAFTDFAGQHGIVPGKTSTPGIGGGGTEQPGRLSRWANNVGDWVEKNPYKAGFGALAGGAMLLSGKDREDDYERKYASVNNINQGDINNMNFYQYNLEKQASAQQMYNEAVYDMQAAEAMYTDALQKMASAEEMYKMAAKKNALSQAASTVGSAIKNHPVASGVGATGVAAGLGGAGYAAANGMLGQGAEFAMSHAMNNVEEGLDTVKQPLLAGYSSASTAMGNMADAAQKSIQNGMNRASEYMNNIGTHINGAYETVMQNPSVALAPAAGATLGGALGGTAGYYAGKKFNAPRAGAVIGGLGGAVAGGLAGNYAATM